MAGTGPGDLDSAALELLTAAVEALDSIPSFSGLDSLSGAPSRAFVSPGRPAADCEQLTVHAQRVAGTPADQKDARQNSVTFVVTLYRCVPKPDASMKAPRPEALEASAAQLNADGWALWNHIFEKIRAGDLFAKCPPIIWDGMDALEPAGGAAGWRLTIRATIDGYQEASA